MDYIQRPVSQAICQPPHSPYSKIERHKQENQRSKKYGKESKRGHVWEFVSDKGLSLFSDKIISPKILRECNNRVISSNLNTIIYGHDDKNICVPYILYLLVLRIYIFILLQQNSD